MPPDDSETPAPDLNAAATTAPTSATTAPTVWQLMKRRKAGEKLTVAEKKILSDYYKPYGRNRAPQYLTDAELEDWSKRAHDARMRLNPWMRQQVHENLMGKSPQEKRLEEEILRIKAERDNLLLQVGNLATENAEAQRKGQNLVDELRDLAKRLAEAREDRERGEVPQ